MPILFALTLFAGALLLLAVQPLTGRLLLPCLGGSPAVWNTCLVFFQGVLLLGYLYSHRISRLQRGVQFVLHLGLLTVVVTTLPIVLARTDPPAAYPAFWLLGTLTLTVGLPFFAVATTSPLLQRWYSDTRAWRAHDPYFLSVASNLGSLAALVAYPFLIEPVLPLSAQGDWWRWGYVVYVVLVAVCVLAASRDATAPGGRDAPADREPARSAGASRLHTDPSPGWWLVLAFVPSSLLVGVTNAITTDVAPMPLLWVVPLALYLVTFIIAFTPGVRLPLARLGKVLAVSAIALSLVLLSGATEPLGLVLGVHLIAFFAAALLCHGRLADLRPHPGRLTEFYLWLSIGGVLGGAFNALLAPVLFQRFGFVEYPLVLLAACLMRPAAPERTGFRPADLAGPVVLGLLAAGVILLARTDSAAGWLAEASETTALPAEMLHSFVCFGVPLIGAYLFVERPARFALGLGALFLAGTLDPGAQGRPLYIERNFLGVVKVTRSPDGEFIRMVHGNTVHGQQRVAPRPAYLAAFALPVGAASPLNELSIRAAVDGRWDDRNRPLTYYHPTGPAGITFRFLVDGWPGSRRIGAVGLGTGAIASYARPDQDWTFYELDPAVERLARDERYFTFLRDSPAGSLRVVLGDARRGLEAEPDGSFDLLVLDAFSSDAIPVHLLTAEAFALYERKLAPTGVILFHLSNRYLDLPPVVARIAQAMPEPMAVRQNDDLGTSDREKDDGKFASVWVAVARRDEDFGPLIRPVRGFLPAPASRAPLWTDDRAHLLAAVRRDEE